MPPQKYNSIYLSGWEYNRLLQDDPLEPRNSSLPGDIFWNGGAQLWMFENVYCTKESLDEEKRCAEVQGWTTAKIFQELEEKEGILKSVDWKDLRESTKVLLQQRHAKLRSEKSEEFIRSLIGDKQTSDLELLKLDLLEPIMQEKNCLPSSSPNSLRVWKRPAIETTTKNVLMRKILRVKKLLADLAAPIDPQQQYIGLRLCNPPGTGVLAEDRARQQKLMYEVEEPIIAKVLAADEPYAGESGHRHYMSLLTEGNRREIYAPIDRQLALDWGQNRSALLRLRDAAKAHLWKNLHDDWLPHLMDKDKGEKFEKKFYRLIKRAARYSPIANYLNVFTTISFNVGGLVGIETFLLLKGLSNFSDTTISASATGIGILSGYTARFAMESEYTKNILQLATFYQNAKRITSL